LFKYVNKGLDIAIVKITNVVTDLKKETITDEIKRYYDCRYLSPCGTVWRTFAFDIHHRWPAVQRLTFYIPSDQSTLFKDDDINVVFNRCENSNTMFLGWFEANRNYTEAKDLTYGEFPSKFVWMAKEKEWKPRKKGYNIGRLTYISFGSGEIYHMRILLTIQKRCVDYESIRTIDGQMFEIFQEACYALGLLADDKEFNDAIKEANEIASGYQFRRLFITLLGMNTISKPDVVWNSTWSVLCDEILYQKRKDLNYPGILYCYLFNYYFLLFCSMFF